MGQGLPGSSSWGHRCEQDTSIRQVWELGEQRHRDSLIRQSARTGQEGTTRCRVWLGGGHGPGGRERGPESGKWCGWTGGVWLEKDPEEERPGTRGDGWRGGNGCWRQPQQDQNGGWGGRPGVQGEATAVMHTLTRVWTGHVLSRPLASLRRVIQSPGT